MQALLLFRDQGVDWSQFEGEERGQALYQRFVDWAAELDKRGVYVAVEALGRTGAKTVRRRGAGIVIDGPFAEGREQVLGYFVVEVADLDAACALAAESPHTAIGGTTEVREVRPFPKPT